MSEYNWRRFVVRIPINASKQTLYDAWTSQRAIEHWFLRRAEFKNPSGQLRGPYEVVQEGDTYEWRWHGWPDEVQERGKILSCNGRDNFQFSFGEAGNCSVTIKSELGQCIIELEQTEIPTSEKGMHDYHVGCKTGWTFHLTNMKSILEGGRDLRNKDENLKNVVNA